MDTYQKILALGLRETGRKYTNKQQDCIYIFQGYAIYRNFQDGSRKIQTIYKFSDWEDATKEQVRSFAKEDSQGMARPHELSIETWGENKVTIQSLIENSLSLFGRKITNDIKGYKEAKQLFYDEIKNNAHIIPSTGRNLALKADESDFLADQDFWKRGDEITQEIKDHEPEPEIAPKGKVHPNPLGSIKKVDGFALTTDRLCKMLIDKKMGYGRIIKFLRSQKGMSKRQAEHTLSRAKRLQPEPMDGWSKMRPFNM